MARMKPELPEGYFTITRREQTTDSDYGDCHGVYIAELGLTIWLYKDHPDTISMHVD